jgi:zinc resistance-associated protein
MKKTIIMGVVLAGLALMSPLASAGGMGYGRGYGMGPGYGMNALSDLTEEQSAKIQAIQDVYVKEAAPLQLELWNKRTELQDLCLVNPPDQARISALQKEMLSIRGQIQERATQAWLEIQAILTPAQQNQMAAYGPGRGWGKGRPGRW